MMEDMFGDPNSAGIKVAIIGECMIELQHKGDSLVQSYGGDTLNTALYLSRLTSSQPVDVAYFTSLGKDKFSHNMLQEWNSEGINTEYVSLSDNKQTGLYLIETDQTGERSFHYWRSDSAAKYWLKEYNIQHLSQVLSGFNIIYLSGISLAILSEENRSVLFGLLETAKQGGAKIVFDNNFRPQLWESAQHAAKAYGKMLSLTDIALLTFDDELAIYGAHTEQQAIERTHQLGVAEVVIKRGAEACIVSKGAAESYIAPDHVDNVVDTTAAGDSFSAGYLARRISGGTAEESARSGHILAGEVIRHPGAIIAEQFMPSINN